MNRKRRTNEGFKQYRANQNAEQRKLDRHMKGRMIWNASRKGAYVRPENRR